MRKFAYAITALLIMSFTVVPKVLNRQEDRKMLLDYMEETKQFFLDNVKDLSDAQLDFKAAPDRWSIRQCMEHIALSEQAIPQFIKSGLQPMSDSMNHNLIKVTDEQVIQMITDRSHKAQAPDMLKPTGKFPTKMDAINAFVKQRDENIDFVKNSQTNLRDMFVKNPVLGVIDEDQAYLFMAAHTKRHTLQIVEVKNTTGFPAN
ncbi:DinB family protein [Danxiaibacter flavus]|uniref:DinB family protein n=1 Tax=Danxiaibacter flavus TaxID=3049108 RepID=A0ABV3ZBS3_9BACT|nr:DinB family protein [Chitinophagaceae bacterium DXS]